MERLCLHLGSRYSSRKKQLTLAGDNRLGSLYCDGDGNCCNEQGKGAFDDGHNEE